MDCIFCKIVAGIVPSVKVYEDDQVLAFLNIEAIREGHTLVIPKRHYEYFYQIEEPDYSAVMAVVKKISQALDDTFSPQRVGLKVEGFEVAHAHVHVLPLDDIGDISTKAELMRPSNEEREQTALRLRERLEPK